MPIERVLLIAGISAELALVALLAGRRIYRVLPVFSMYVVWGLLSDCAMPLIQAHAPSSYVRSYLVETSFDSLLQYGVLVELAWSVLRPFHTLPPRRVLAATGLGVLLAGALVWPLTFAPEMAQMRWDFVLILRLEQTFSLLRVAFFLVLAIASHWLTVGWRNRELQVATGLGVYSLVSLIGALIHKHQILHSPSFHWVEFAISSSYFASLLYWMVSFAQKEPPPRSLPDRAHRALTGLAETAREQRAAVEKLRARE